MTFDLLNLQVGYSAMNVFVCKERAMSTFAYLVGCFTVTFKKNIPC